MTDVQMTARVTLGDQFETVHYPDDEILLRVTNGGNVQVIEYISKDREGPPPHSHAWDEIEFVIEGEVDFYVNGQWTHGGPGTVQMLPAGAYHSVRVPEGTARLLFITSGPPFDGMAREMAAFFDRGTYYSDLSPLREIAGRYGLRLEDNNPTSG
ncbi:MAG: cupin domain-containing protein [Candidatus Promineifilaceae bacterium]|nr:cupin domain-containing protein [Candidatus Promineifilaceae bacterium]